MDIIVSKGVGWSTSAGVFDCIVESTRKLLLVFGEDGVREIYGCYDEQGQAFIALDSVGMKLFNQFYCCCERAMKEFPSSERAAIIPVDHVAGVLWNWSELLKLMRADARYFNQLKGSE
ncbi:hypothetical protein [Pseudomonas anguilliseptica]|uniref:hypothetical protein n=1 Tax=Pseudomonas anguilliseptica TaxID=53406 RepID=UPI0022AFCDCF|nr:hypothetical protein [Pseudomonas anguilliseptica]MCZ4322771.1 hypothetical protein [Pseudomonas anguilliseptica]